jgi:hypothetical protein
MTGERASKTRSLERRPKSRKGTMATARPKPTCAAERTVDSEKSRAGAWAVIGDGMIGSVGELSSELPHRDRIGVHARKRAEEPTGGSQSVRSSEEAGNDRGAKGRRKVEA